VQLSLQLFLLSHDNQILLLPHLSHTVCTVTFHIICCAWSLPWNWNTNRLLQTLCSICTVSILSDYCPRPCIFQLHSGTYHIHQELNNLVVYWWRACQDFSLYATVMLLHLFLSQGSAKVPYTVSNMQLKKEYHLYDCDIWNN
jgi:hypothetical protein